MTAHATMQTKETIMLTPGPVPVRQDISAAQDQLMISHRSAEFGALYENLCRRLTDYLGATEAFVLTGSGALGLEALFANLTFREQTALCLPNGEFGEKLVETARVYTSVKTATLPGGQGWNLARAKAHIDASGAEVLALLYNETGYGVKNDIEEICRYAKSKSMITIIDGVSAWPGTKFNMKDFSVDGFVTGSQKDIGAPPGLALLGLSRTAADRIRDRASIPSYYFDLRRHQKRFAKDKQTPNTPAISLMWALQKAFDILDESGGLDECVTRHTAAAAHLRERLKTLGFKLVAEEGFASNTVTGFVCQSATQAKMIKSRLEKDYHIIIAGCRGDFTDTGLRIAHMGNFDPAHLEQCLRAIEDITKNK